MTEPRHATDDPPAAQGDQVAMALLRHGLQQAHQGDPAATQTLNSAFESAKVQDLPRCLLLAAAALLINGQAMGNYRRFPEYIAVLGPLRQGDAGLNDWDDALLAQAGLLAGLLFFHPNDEALDVCAERVLAVLELDAEPNLQLAAGHLVLLYAEPREKRQLGQRVNALLLRSALASPTLTAHRLGHWLWSWSRFLLYAKETRQAEQVVAQLRELVARHGLRDIAFLLAIGEVHISLPSGDLGRAQAAIEAALALVDPARPFQQLQLEVAMTRFARLSGQADSALLHAACARGHAVELQVSPPTMAACIVNEAQALLMAGDSAAARGRMTQALDLVPEGFAQEIRGMIDLIAADEAITQGAADGPQRLARVWADLRARQFYDSFDGYPEFGARLCVLALEHEVETDFVRGLIEKTGLAPPPGAPAAWPWPLRIHALGQFGVQRHGQPLTFEGRAQKKPLELLKAVVAYGALTDGQGVDVDTLVQALWPDPEASDPKASFDATLSRLRKWLSVEGALKLSDSRLSLNSGLVWRDVAAFEQQCDRLQRVLRPHGAADAVTQAMAAAGQIVGLYRGALFGATTLEPWGLRARERLAMRFARCITDHGHQLETALAWDAALRVYEQGLEHDLLAEPIYAALMRCHLALGQPAQALRVFQRCSDMLLTALRVRPGAETLALAERIPRG